MYMNTKQGILIGGIIVVGCGIGLFFFQDALRQGSSIKENNPVIELNEEQDLSEVFEGFRITQFFELDGQGMDFAPIGENPDVLSFSSGNVTKVGFDDTYGNYIKILNDDLAEVLYAHCDTVFVQEGEYVEKTMPLCTAGTSGKTLGNGPTFHLEIRVDGELVNPWVYLGIIKE